MAPNKKVWDDFHAHNKKIIVLEVGGLIRGTTWKVAVGGINREAYFGPKGNDNSRANKLGLELKPWTNNGDSIVIVGQHERSHQWRNNPNMSSWVSEQIRKIREHTDKDIIWRPHPRFPVNSLEEDFKNVLLVDGKLVKGTFELYNIIGDPGEENNLIDLYPDVAERLRQQLDSWSVSVSRSALGADYPEGKHGCWNRHPWFMPMVDDIDRWFQKHL